MGLCGPSSTRVMALKHESNHITQKSLVPPYCQQDKGHLSFAGLVNTPTPTCVPLSGLFASSPLATESYCTLYSSHTAHSSDTLDSPGTASILPKLVTPFKQAEMHACLFFCIQLLILFQALVQMPPLWCFLISCLLEISLALCLHLSLLHPSYFGWKCIY